MKQLAIGDSAGRKLAALYDAPSGSEPFPLVIMLHGNTGWKEEVHLATLAADLAKSGIAALRFDAPGSGESDGTWADDYRVSNYLAAVQDVYDFAVQNFPIDRNRVGIWGHSMGGMVAIYAAVRQPEIFKAVCGCEPSAGNMSTHTRPEAETWRERGGASIDTEIFGKIWLPADYFLDRLNFNTAAEVKKLHAPILLIAGQNDDRVPPASVRKIFEAANEPKQFLEFPTDHFYKRDPRTLLKINSSAEHFFQKRLLYSSQ